MIQETSGNIDDLELRIKAAQLEKMVAETKKLEQDTRASRLNWTLIGAIIAAFIGVGSNTLVAYLTGRSQQEIEDKKARANLIIEAIKTGIEDRERARANLQFFLDIGLLSDPDGLIADAIANERTPVLPAGLAPGSRTSCGVERWPVKTGTDRDVGNVSIQAEASSVEALRALVAPTKWDGRNTRYAPTELKTFQITGRLTVIRREADGDYLIVISNDQGNTMIIESVDPQCADGSRFIDQIAIVRRTIDAKFGPITARAMPNVRATVTGVAFFDRVYGQEGVAPNGIELHPILNISFE
jgi:hypothetical protein